MDTLVKLLHLLDDQEKGKQPVENDNELVQDDQGRESFVEEVEDDLIFNEPIQENEPVQENAPSIKKKLLLQ